ncbi:MAG: tetratricopeptide repeat protein, partial [Kiloniellales bacterium]|nr:tetratricopeptide repeat protein [Kiloniellales bacterium]
MLDRALERIFLGRSKEAAVMLKRAVKSQPKDPRASLYYGIALLEIGRAIQAVGPLEKAVGLDPNSPDAYYHLGRALAGIGRNDAAADAFSRALALRPEFGEAYLELGSLLLHNGMTGQAADCFRLATQFCPDNADAYFRLGLAESDRDRTKEALDAYLGAVAIDPGHASAHINLGTIALKFEKKELAVRSFRSALEAEPGNVIAHVNLASVLRDIGEHADSEEQARKALELNPNSPEAHNCLGNTLKEQSKNEEAVNAFKTAIKLKADDAHIHYNLGDAYHRDWRFPQALSAYRKALELNPKLAKGWNNLGLVLVELGKLEEGLDAFRTAHMLEPDHDGYKCSYGNALYKTGRVAESWEYAIACFRCGLREPYRRFSIPLWRGEPLQGKRLLIWREQGLGDALMHAQRFPQVIGQADETIIETEKRLVSIFRRSFPGARVIEENSDKDAERKDADFHVPAGFLEEFYPKSFVELAINQHGPRPEKSSLQYLHGDPILLEKWRRRVSETGPGLKVGICWRSGLSGRLRNIHYSSLTQWGPLFALEGIQWIVLQYGDCKEELDGAKKKFGVELHLWDDVDLKDDMEDIFALTDSVDLVVTPATAVRPIRQVQGGQAWQFATDAPEADWPPVEHDLGLNWSRHAEESWEDLFSRMADR